MPFSPSESCLQHMLLQWSVCATATVGCSRALTIIIFTKSGVAPAPRIELRAIARELASRRSDYFRRKHLPGQCPNQPVQLLPPAHTKAACHKALTGQSKAARCSENGGLNRTVTHSKVQEVARPVFHAVKLFGIFQLQLVLHVRLVVYSSEVIVPAPLSTRKSKSPSACYRVQSHVGQARAFRQAISIAAQ